MKKGQPKSYYERALADAEAELSDLDQQICEALKPMAHWSANDVRNVEMLLKPKTDRVNQLRREITQAKNALRAPNK